MQAVNSQTQPLRARAEAELGNQASRLGQQGTRLSSLRVGDSKEAPHRSDTWLQGYITLRQTLITGNQSPLGWAVSPFQTPAGRGPNGISFLVHCFDSRGRYSASVLLRMCLTTSALLDDPSCHQLFPLHYRIWNCIARQWGHCCARPVLSHNSWLSHSMERPVLALLSTCPRRRGEPELQQESDNSVLGKGVHLALH